MANRYTHEGNVRFMKNAELTCIRFVFLHWYWVNNCLNSKTFNRWKNMNWF